MEICERNLDNLKKNKKSEKGKLCKKYIYIFPTAQNGDIALSLFCYKFINNTKTNV